MRTKPTVWRKVLSLAGRFVAGFFIFLLGYSAVLYVLSRITVDAAQTGETPSVPIYIKTNGVHSDLVVPYRHALKDWSLLLPSSDTQADDDGAAWLSVGWGDRDFYLHTPTWADLKATTALNAICYLGTSVIHAEWYAGLKENERCRKIEITETQYNQLVAYIEGSFSKREGRPVLIDDAAYGSRDAFYEAVGSYSGAYTCNSWVNQGLKAAGQKAALWTLTDTGIFCHYEE